ILRFLHASPTPLGINEIIAATNYNQEAGRKMLWRMRQAGDLVHTPDHRFTTANHPCLAPPASVPSPVAPVLAPRDPSTPASEPRVPGVSPVLSQEEIPIPGSEPPVPGVSPVLSPEETPTHDCEPHVPSVPSVLSPDEPLAHDSATPVPDVVGVLS